MRYRFADFDLDTDRMELKRNQQAVHLEPQVINLLAYLIQHRHRVVAREELHQVIWGRRIVTDNTLSVRINALRKALGDDGQRQALVRTVPRLGYRFEASIRASAGGSRPSAAAATGIPTAAARPGTNSDQQRASIVILPFRNLNGHHGSAFAQGLTHDLTTGVARSRRIVVLARSMAFELGSEADVLEVGRALGVRYVCSGWVRSSGPRLRVNVALSRTETREEIWSACSDHLLGDHVLVDATVTDAIVSGIEREIDRVERTNGRQVRAGATDQ